MRNLRHIALVTWILLMITCLLAVPVFARYAGQAVATMGDAADLRRENAQMRRDIANLRGVVHDMGESMRYYTHPATVNQRFFDYMEGRGEFGTSK